MRTLVALILTTALSSAADVAQLGFLAGCWEVFGQGVEEQWMKPAGGSLLGMSRTVKAGKTVFYEQILIRKTGEDIFYEVRLGGQPKVTAFKLVKIGEGEVVFENPEHDFPQRILYRRDGDKLHARIEGLRQGQLRGQDIPMQRTRCE